MLQPLQLRRGAYRVSALLGTERGVEAHALATRFLFSGATRRRRAWVARRVGLGGSEGSVASCAGESSSWSIIAVLHIGRIARMHVCS